MPNSLSMQYQRVITGYHGCDRETVRKVVYHEEHLEPSQNKFDWLGTGVYFWEYGPRRALQFAREQKKRDKVDEPAVLGAYINLGRCFDLADVEHTSQLRTAYEVSPLWWTVNDLTPRRLQGNRVCHEHRIRKNFESKSYPCTAQAHPWAS